MEKYYVIGTTEDGLIDFMCRRPFDTPEAAQAYSDTCHPALKAFVVTGINPNL